MAGLDPEMPLETRSEIRASILLMSVPDQRTLLLKHEAKLSIGSDQLVMTFIWRSALTLQTCGRI